MSEAVTSDLNKYLDREDKAGFDLEFFNDDTESLFNIIEEQLVRIRDIADGYELDLEGEIRKQVIDILTNGKGLEDETSTK